MISTSITLKKAVIIFTVSTLYFYLLLFTLLPFTKSEFILNPALYWFITGYFLFIPLFIYAVMKVKSEGNNGVRQILNALSIKSFSKKDWLYSITGLFLVFLFTGFIFGISILLNKFSGIRMLNTTPWFMEMQPFQGIEKLLLLVWIPMFFFNIAGEEFLWRGYIQSRLHGKHSWMICSALWMMFHIPFGFDLIIMAMPALVIIPYVFYKTENTLTGIFIHGIYNGPIFAAIALGLM